MFSVEKIRETSRQKTIPGSVSGLIFVVIEVE